jgi:hypothetical protein
MASFVTTQNLGYPVFGSTGAVSGANQQLTAAQSRTLVSLNAAGGNFWLPPTTGSVGAEYRFDVDSALTAAYVISPTGLGVINGICYQSSGSAGPVTTKNYASATSVTIGTNALVSDQVTFVSTGKTSYHVLGFSGTGGVFS